MTEMCNNRKCLRRKTCYRFTTIPVKGWQKRVNFDYEKGNLCYKEDHEIKKGE